MDNVVLDGVQYIKASVAAKDFKYSSDYIGQLCRARKVDSRLVGRTWFVNPDSIEKYKRLKHNRSLRKSEPTQGINKKTKLSQKNVVSVMQNKTAKLTNNLPIKLNGVETLKLAVTYELDDELLIPELTKKKVGQPRTICVEQAGAKNILVKGKQKNTAFKAGELPDVALSGRLDITSYPAKKVAKEGVVNSGYSENSKGVGSFKKVKNNQENKVISPKPDNKKPKSEAVEFQDKLAKKLKVKLIKGDHQVTDADTNSPFLSITTTKKEKETVNSKILVSDISKLQFTPATVLQTTKKKTPTVILISPLIATLLAFISVLLIISASTLLEVSEVGYNSIVIFEMKNLLEVFGQ